MDLTLAATPLLLILCVLAALALAAFTYRRSTPTVAGARRWVLVGLRTGALAIVLLLLFEPIWRRVDADQEPPVLAVLVDASQSTTLEPDDGASAADQLREALGAVRRLGLPDDAVRLYRFDAAAAPLDVAPESLAFDGARTDIARALDAVAEDLDGANLSGVLLLSDGRYTAGRNPIYLAERYPVPIYTATVGDTTAQRDVRLTRVVTNEIAYVGVELPVQVGVLHDGFAGERVTVSLLEDGARLASESVTLGDDGTEATVDLAVTPSAPGLRRYTVAVSRLDGEATTRNNVESVAVRVLENERQVLLVAAAPGPDVAALRRLLGTDRDVEVVTRTQRAPGQFYEGALPARLDAFDLLVLAGYPGPEADASTTRRLAEAAADDLPLLFVLTAQTDAGALGAAFEDVLPVVPERARTLFYEAQLAPTQAGAYHPVLQIPDAATDRLDRLPPILYNESRWRATPDAQTLATIQVQGTVLDAPLVVVRRRGAQRSAALLGAGAWRWANLPEDLADVDGFYPGLTTNLLRWLTTREDRRPVRVRPTRDLFGDGEPVTFTGQVYDEALTPVSDATLEVTVTAPDGTTTPHGMRAVGNGRYVLDLGARPEGDYRFSATATAADSGTPLGEDGGSFAVGALALEFRTPTADASLMRQLAQRSGGAVVPASDLGGFADLLAQPGRFEARTVETERETPLWHLPWLLALAVVLLAAEWVLRKRAGMV